MKICSKCRTQYSDNTLSFCLQDGTPLTGPTTTPLTNPQAETPTVVLGETDTLSDRRDAMRVPVGDPNPTAAPVTNVIPAQVGKKSSNTVLAVAITAFGMLVLFGLLGLAAILYFRSAPEVTVKNSDPAQNTSKSSPPSNTASPVRTNTPPSEPATPRTTPAPQQPALSNYPSTTRLKFARGSFATSFSGAVNPGDNRSLILSCRSGQTLSASVSSGGGCITLGGGGTSLRTTTNGGDNYITVTNKCSSAARFTISVSII